MKKLTAVVLLGMVAGLMILANAWKSHLRVQRVTVNGNMMLSSETLIKSARISEGQLLDDVDLYGVRSRLQKSPYLRAVSVQRELPDRIAIDVVERVPVAILFSDQPLFLDREGFVLPAANTEGFFDLPVITGDFPGELKSGGQVNSPALREALNIAMVVQAVGDLDARVSELHIARTGDIVLYTAEGGIPVLLGKSVSDEQLASFIAFWKQVVMRRDVRQLELVDVRFENQIVARWRQG